ncbi:hypothetical protein HHI36_005648 [Cryptolaemus montrouzieri]|uniref:Uncharacterized protein n=1 Tax=Cryptolaemus montrouzieri TaxID=559131 RepID=A0ABD2NUZ8_9CUCU
MIRMFLWQMYLDVEITNLGISLVEIDKLLDENPASYVESCHHPFEHIYFFQFIQSLMGTALLVHYKSREEVHSSEGLTSYIFQKFLLERLFVKAGCHRGRCLFEFKDVLPIKNVYALYLRLGEPHTARQFLNVACTKKGEEPPCYRAWSGNKESLIANFLGNNVNAVGHNFLYIPEKEVVGEQPEEYLNEIEEIDPYFQDLSTLRILGPKIIVQCLYTVCPAIIQNNLICTMDYSMTFLEFYEVLICCALSVLAKIRKKKIFIKKLFTEEPKAEDIADLDTSSRKGSAKLKRKK